MVNDNEYDNRLSGVLLLIAVKYHAEKRPRRKDVSAAPAGGGVVEASACLNRALLEQLARLRQVPDDTAPRRL
jgi:hypothetical protein